MFEPEDLLIINRKTGEEIPVELLVKRSEIGWERAYADNVADMYSLKGDAGARVISWILKNKDGKNRFRISHDEIAEELSISRASVSRTFNSLMKCSNPFIVKIRPTVYMLSPHVMRYGSASCGVALLTLWDQALKDRNTTK
jgi:hypothetical protein